MRYFSVEDILLLHFKIIEDYGGSHGVRSEDRLQSVAAGPAQEVFGTMLYSSLFEQAAVYLRGIVADHPFVDGNKRTAVTVAGIFLSRGGHELAATPWRLEDFAVQVAVDHLDIPAIAAWLQAHSRRN